MVSFEWLIWLKFLGNFNFFQKRKIDILRGYEQYSDVFWRRIIIKKMLEGKKDQNCLRFGILMKNHINAFLGFSSKNSSKKNE